MTNIQSASLRFQILIHPKLQQPVDDVIQIHRQISSKHQHQKKSASLYYTFLLLPDDKAGNMLLQLYKASSVA